MLIDTLIPNTVLPKPDSKGSAREDEEAVGHFVEQVDGTDCQLAHDVMPFHMSPEAFRLKAKSLYGPGVENLFFWDAAGPRGHADISAAWNDLRCLGHGEEIEQWRQLGEPSLAFASVPVPRVGDFDLTYRTPAWREEIRSSLCLAALSWPAVLDLLSRKVSFAADPGRQRRPGRQSFVAPFRSEDRQSRGHSTGY